MTYLILAFFIGVALGHWGGMRVGWRHVVWRVRMHFYSQGMSHQAVDRVVTEILHNPGMPEWRSYNRIRAQRAKAGLKP